jgi:chemotaxis methyl-accepting protein methylase
MTSRLTVDDLSDDPGFEMLSNKITRDTAFRCASYKDRCLQRRIAARMRATGVATFAEYAAVLDADPDEYPRLLDALTINVTKCFRNWPTWEVLAQNVIPRLWVGGWRIRIWCAGVASGEEAYSLAALFHQHAEACGDADVVAERVRIVGSDIDRRSLAAARHGVYAPSAFVETPAELADRYFPRTRGELRSVVPELRSMVTFEHRDLLHQSPPQGTFELITCRNVVIYFDRAAQDTLFTSFHSALVPGGYLVLGRVETLLGKPRSLFTPLELRERVFRRVG